MKNDPVILVSFAIALGAVASFIVLERIYFFRFRSSLKKLSSEVNKIDPSAVPRLRDAITPSLVKEKSSNMTLYEEKELALISSTVFDAFPEIYRLRIKSLSHYDSWTRIELKMKVVGVVAILGYILIAKLRRHQ
jgi:hypothetical protein